MTTRLHDGWRDVRGSRKFSPALPGQGGKDPEIAVRRIMGPPDHIEYNCWVWGDFSGDLPRADAAVCFTDSHVAYVIGSDNN